MCGLSQNVRICLKVRARRIWWLRKKIQFCNSLMIALWNSCLKPSAYSRFLSLRHAIVGFFSCRTQQIFIVDRYKVWSAPLWNILQALRRNDIARQIRTLSTLYLCMSIGLVSHVFHNFCRDTPHTADFCFWFLAIKNKYQTCLNSKLSLLR